MASEFSFLRRFMGSGFGFFGFDPASRLEELRGSAPAPERSEDVVSETLSQEYALAAKLLINNILTKAQYEKDEAYLSLNEFLQKKFDIPDIEEGSEKVLEAVEQIEDPKVKLALTLLYKQCSKKTLNTPLRSLLRFAPEKEALTALTGNLNKFKRQISLRDTQSFLDLFLTTDLFPKEITLGKVCELLSLQIVLLQMRKIGNPHVFLKFKKDFEPFLILLCRLNDKENFSEAVKEFREFDFSLLKSQMRECAHLTMTRGGQFDLLPIINYIESIESGLPILLNQGLCFKPCYEALVLTHDLKHQTSTDLPENLKNRLSIGQLQKTSIEDGVMKRSFFFIADFMMASTKSFCMHMEDHLEDTSTKFCDVLETFDRTQSALQDILTALRMQNNSLYSSKMAAIKAYKQKIDNFLAEEGVASNYIKQLIDHMEAFRFFVDRGYVPFDSAFLQIHKAIAFLENIISKYERMETLLEDLKTSSEVAIKNFDVVIEALPLTPEQKATLKKLSQVTEKSRIPFFKHRETKLKTTKTSLVNTRHAAFACLKMLRPDKPFGWTPSVEDLISILDSPEEDVTIKEKPPEVDESGAAAAGEEDISPPLELEEDVEDESDVDSLDESFLQSFANLSLKEVREHIIPLTIQEVKHAQMQLWKAIPAAHPQRRLLQLKVKEIEPHVALATQSLIKVADLVKNGQNLEALPFYVQNLLLDIHTAIESYFSAQFLLKYPDTILPKDHDLYDLAVKSDLMDGDNPKLARFLLDYRDANFAARFPERMKQLGKRGTCHQIMQRARSQQFLDVTKLLKDMGTFFEILLGKDSKANSLHEALAKLIESKETSSKKHLKRTQKDSEDIKALKVAITKCQRKIETQDPRVETIHLKEALFLMQQALVAKQEKLQHEIAGIKDMKFSHLRGELFLEKALEEIFVHMYLQKYNYLVIDHNLEFYLDALDLPERIKGSPRLVESIKDCNLGILHHYFMSNGEKKGSVSGVYKRTLEAQRQRMLAVSGEGFQAEGQKPYPDRQVLDRKLRDLTTVIRELLI